MFAFMGLIGESEFGFGTAEVAISSPLPQKVLQRGRMGVGVERAG